MTGRLKVLFDEDEYQDIQGCARSQWMTVVEWVRQALRAARDDSPGRIDAKLRALADASRHEFPTADIGAMLREIESGRRQAG